MRRVERALNAHFSQRDFFVTDIKIADGGEIRALNKAARGVDAVTDVLSFPAFDSLRPPVVESSFSAADRDGKRVILGSIMICRGRAEEQARELGHGYDRELGFLTCHGLLHLMGFDHMEKEDETDMLFHQRAVMEAAKLKRDKE